MSDSNSDFDMVYIGGMWQQKSRKGNTYFSLRTNVPIEAGQKVLAFFNSKKDRDDPDDKKPHYKLYTDKPEEEPDNKPDAPDANESMDEVPF